MFVICVIRPSRLPHSDVILLKNFPRYEVASKRSNDQLSKFPSKGYKYSTCRDFGRFKVRFVFLIL